jgi:hypothetical protein
VAQSIHFMLDAEQGLIRRFERTVLHPQRTIFRLQIIKRFQVAPHGSDLLLQTGARTQKGRDILINARLQLAGATHTQTQKIPQTCHEKHQRNNARATHLRPKVRRSNLAIDPKV